SEPWEIDKYGGFRQDQIGVPGVPGTHLVNFTVLKEPAFGFPPIQACYVRVTERTDPVRVETFPALGTDQIAEASRRAFIYARLLPGYGFPVGLDIADKYTHVPTWMTDAYSKLIRFQLGVSLQRGEVSDVEMRRILVQAIYMTHRDWLFRPDIQ